MSRQEGEERRDEKGKTLDAGLLISQDPTSQP